MPACRSCTPVRSFSGLTWTIVTTGVRSANVLADMHRPLRDDAGDRRAHHRVVELLDRQVVGGAAVLQQRLLPARGVDGRLVRRFGHLQPGVGRLQIDRRHQAARGERLRPFGIRPRVIAVGQRVLHRADLIVVGRRVAAVESIGHAELGAGLPQRALGARQRQRQFPRLELDERIADADLAADFHQRPSGPRPRPRR